MADQRQPFRFRLPWLPPTSTPAPAPAPRQPAPAPKQPAAAPPRPPFRPGGVAPTQPPPRADPPQPAPAPPKVVEQGSASKPTSPPKTEPPSKPIASTTPQTKPPQPAPPKTEPPSKPIASTASQSTPPQPAAPKTGTPSTISTPTEAEATASRPISPPKPPKQPPTPPSPRAASRPPSPTQLAPRPKPSAPSSSSPASPQVKKSPNSPKREPSPTPKYPNPPTPTLADQNSSSKKELEKPETQVQSTIASENAPDSSKLPQSRMVSDEVVSPKPLLPTSHPDSKESKEVKRAIDEPILQKNGEPRMKEVTEIPESETVLEPVAVSQGKPKEEIVHRKEMIPKSGVAQGPAEKTSFPSYPRVGKPQNSHKPVGEKAPLQKEIKEDISKFVQKLGNGQGKQTLDSDKQLTVITLAGENRGASMVLSNESRKRESSIHIHRGYRSNPDEGIENSTDGEENSKTDEETATKAYINSNVQGINNSLLFHGSVSTKNPGVRYIRSLQETSNGRRQDEVGNYETRKAEFSGIQSEMLAYAPTVRRRCLRGLLMESNDSDQEKPRRHGCRYACKGNNKEEDIDIL